MFPARTSEDAVGGFGKLGPRGFTTPGPFPA